MSILSIFYDYKINKIRKYIINFLIFLNSHITFLLIYTYNSKHVQHLNFCITLRVFLKGYYKIKSNVEAV
jgi:hypothetical protein